MIKDFILPDIGEGVVECELVEWLVAEGDSVSEDQPIADVMTDKALVQIPAPYNGVITKLHYAKGDIAKVHAPLYSIEIEEAAEAGHDTPSAPEDDSASVTQQHKPGSAPATGGFVVEDFLLPDIGEGIVECELVEWLVEEGEFVVEDQPIADVMTDKALVQIPAIKPGKIAKLHYRKGQLAIVHQPLYAIEVAASGATADNSVATPSVSSDNQKIGNQGSHSYGADNHNITLGAGQTVASPLAPSRQPGKALASPAVRRMARSHDVDLSQVPGSGKNGRVYKDDLRRYLSQSSATPESGADLNHASTQPPMPAIAALSAETGDRTEPIRGIKAVMAKAMQESVSTIPHFTYCEELDVTELMVLRAEMKAKYASDELSISLMPFMMKAMSLALKEFPVLNSQVNADCTELTYKADHNIGMAVDAKVGLLVPNIKQVQHKSILDIAAEITRLTRDARAGRVAPADLKGDNLHL